MPRYIDFVPKRPRSAVPARPTVPEKTEKPILRTTPKPVSKPSPKPTSKPTPKPVPKPIAKTVKKTTVTVTTNAIPRRRTVAPRGLRIDFARPANRPVVHKTPATHPTPRPVAISHHAPAPAPTKPVKPAPLSIKISRKPTRAPTPTPKPTPVVEPEEFDDFAGFDDVEPLMSDDDLSLALAGFVDDDSTPPLTDSLSKEVNDFEDELDALDELDILSDVEAEAEDFVEEPKPLFDSTPKKKPFAPLGDRSRFITSVSVEKRPLSSTASAASAASAIKPAPVKPTKSAKFIKPIKSAKSTKPNKSTSAERRAPVISTPEPKSHSFAMTLAIILTIILGAGLGAVVYLAFFQE